MSYGKAEYDVDLALVIEVEQWPENLTLGWEHRKRNGNEAIADPRRPRGETKPMPFITSHLFIITDTYDLFNVQARSFLDPLLI